MLNFFVLGLIPGTNLQITFSWVLVAAIIADIIFGIFYISVILYRHRQLASINKHVETGQQMILFN